MKRSNAYRDIELLTVQIQDRIGDCSEKELQKLQAELSALTESNCWWAMYRIEDWLGQVVAEAIQRKAMVAGDHRRKWREDPASE